MPVQRDETCPVLEPDAKPAALAVGNAAQTHIVDPDLSAQYLRPPFILCDSVHLGHHVVEGVYTWVIAYDVYGNDEQHYTS